MIDPTDAPRPNKRVLAKAKTRQRVLAAATALFEAGDYGSVTIRDIAAATGMSTGAIFANFVDKAALWSAVYGGPPPSPLVADEIARTLGQLPDWTWTLGNAASGFTVALISPDWSPADRGAHEYMGRGDSPASALRAARLAVLDALDAVEARASHAVRTEAA